MEQIQELLNILKQTPEMALWGLTIWCLYILLKLASVVYAVKEVAKLAINKWHDYKVKRVDLEREDLKLKLSQKDIELQKSEQVNIENRFKFDKENQDIKKLAKRFKSAAISSVEMDDLIRLLDCIKSTNYIHQSDITKAIKTLSK